MAKGIRINKVKRVGFLFLFIQFIKVLSDKALVLSWNKCKEKRIAFDKFYYLLEAHFSVRVMIY